MNITRNQAIAKIINLMENGCSIPICSIGDGGAGYCLISPLIDINNFLRLCYDTDDYDFNVIPMDDIAEDFKRNGINPNDYDICVELKEKIDGNPYREQYLLWDID